MPPSPEVVPPAAPPPEAPPKPPSRAVAFLRAAIRELAAAVYVYVAFGLLVTFVAASPLGVLVLEGALCFLGAALLATWTHGSLPATGLVGLLVALLDVALAFVTLPPDVPLGRFLLSEAGPTVLFTLAGFAGAFLVRLRRARRGVSKAPPPPA